MVWNGSNRFHNMVFLRQNCVCDKIVKKGPIWQELEENKTNISAFQELGLNIVVIDNNCYRSTEKRK